MPGAYTEVSSAPNWRRTEGVATTTFETSGLPFPGPRTRT